MVSYFIMLINQCMYKLMHPSMDRKQSYNCKTTARLNTPREHFVRQNKIMLKAKKKCSQFSLDALGFINIFSRNKRWFIVITSLKSLLYLKNHYLQSRPDSKEQWLKSCRFTLITTLGKTCQWLMRFPRIMMTKFVTEIRG